MNAAVELAEIFQNWRSNPSINVYDARGETGDKGTSLGYWADYQRTLELISDLDYALDALQSKGKSRDRFDSLMVRIWRYVVLPGVNWSAVNDNQISIEDINLLLTLGDVVEVHVPEANRMEEPDREVVRGLLQEASEAAGECSDLPEKIRKRLSDLLNKLDNLLDPVNDSNPRQVHRALDEMTAVLLRAVWATPRMDLKYKLLNTAMRLAQATGESASYDIIKAIAATPTQEMLGLPTSEES